MQMRVALVLLTTCHSQAAERGTGCAAGGTLTADSLLSSYLHTQAVPHGR